MTAFEPEDERKPLVRPSHTSTINALTLTHARLGILHTDEEADLAAVLEHIDDLHRGADEPDDPDNWLTPWGTCSCCGTEWPCPTWRDFEQTALIYLGRAQDRVWAHAQQTLASTTRQEKTA